VSAAAHTQWLEPRAVDGACAVCPDCGEYINEDARDLPDLCPSRDGLCTLCCGGRGGCDECPADEVAA